jgi:predicted alpha-1,6-mannanase (GH76 family)
MTGDEYASYWIFAHGFQSVVDYYKFNGSEPVRQIMHNLFSTAVRLWPGWIGYGFYDDMSWMATTLVKAYETTRSEEYLQGAEGIVEILATQGWDTTCCGAHKFGIWWNDKKNSKCTASNLTGVIAALALYRLTGKNKYKAFGMKVYDPWVKYMYNPDLGQVYDRIADTGVISKAGPTYDSGLMIGASVEMYKVTGDSKYLDMAKKAAHYLMHFQSADTPLGPVLNDGQVCVGNCPQFKNPAYRYLVDYYKVTGDEVVYTYLKNNVAAIWNYATRRLKNGKFVFGSLWTGPKPGSLISNAQMNSAVSAIILFSDISNSRGGTEGGIVEEGYWKVHHGTTVTNSKINLQHT